MRKATSGNAGNFTKTVKEISMAKKVKIFTLDTETYDGVKGKLKRIAIYDGKEVIYGFSFKDVEKVLLKYSKKYDVHIYVHNLEFDLRKIIHEISEKIIWEKSLSINRKVATVKCEGYTFHDSYKILPLSLKALSKGFDVECGKLDLWEEIKKYYDYDYESESDYVEKTHKGNWEEYCKENLIYTDLVDFLDRCDINNELFLRYLGYDVISLYQILQKLMELLSLSESEFVKVKSTSSLSRSVFKNGYGGKEFRHDGNMKTDFEMLCKYQWLKNPEAEEFVRAGYYGGRTEVFKMRLDGHAYHYDYNSIYPSMMTSGAEYPIGKPRLYDEKPAVAENEWNQWLENRIGLGFLHCDVYVPEQNVPPLPCKMGKLAFPCGHIYGVWTFEELEYAIKECGVVITQFYGVCIFDETYPVFENFVDTFADLKVQASIDGNIALRTICKLLLNTGYGYTGMSREGKTQLRPYSEISKYEYIRWGDEELGYIEVDSNIKATYIQPQIAAYVTSRARIALHKALKYCAEQGEIYYCDTDSVVTSVPLPTEWCDDNALHKWKLEAEPIAGLFLKPKVYTEKFPSGENEVKFKGVTKDTQKTLSFDYYEWLYDMMANSKEEKVLVENKKVVLRSIMYHIKKKIDFDYFEERCKEMKLHVKEKRILDFANNRTIPYFFESIEAFDNFSFDEIKSYVDIDPTEGGHD